MATPNQQQLNQHIQVILNCLQLCEKCAAECTDQGDISLAYCIKLCHACANSCLFCARLLSSGLPQANAACKVCADLCDACEAECRKGKIDIMQRCADACRQCADACRKMAS